MQNKEIQTIDDAEDMLQMIENLFLSADDEKKKIESEIASKEDEQMDLLHELELADLNAIELMQVSKRLVKVRKERREAKDRLKLINTIRGYTDIYIRKGIVADTRQARRNLENLKVERQNREYTPRILKDLKCAKKKKEEK